jgi:glutamate-ammonia-ligase adenylyltransferase
VPALRRRATLDALAALASTKILKPREYRLLADGYLFLRKLDHRLRLERDQSIDAFEVEPGRLDGIAKALGYGNGNSGRAANAAKSGKKLIDDYRQRREKIRTCYEQYFAKFAS